MYLTDIGRALKYVKYVSNQLLLIILGKHFAES